MKIDFTNEDLQAINKIIDTALRGGGIGILQEVSLIGTKINQAAMKEIGKSQKKQIKDITNK